MSNSIRFRGDPLRINWQHRDEDICAYCDAPIPEDAVPLIVFQKRGALAAKFCDRCAEECFGMRTFE